LTITPPSYLSCFPERGCALTIIPPSCLSHDRAMSCGISGCFSGGGCVRAISCLVWSVVSIQRPLRPSTTFDSGHHSGRLSGSEIVAIVSKVTITLTPELGPENSDEGDSWLDTPAPVAYCTLNRRRPRRTRAEFCRVQDFLGAHRSRGWAPQESTAACEFMVARADRSNVAYTFPQQAVKSRFADFQTLAGPGGVVSFDRLVGVAVVRNKTQSTKATTL
jgi:hypothetical protein